MAPKAPLALVPSDWTSALPCCHFDPCSLHLAMLVSLLLWDFLEPSFSIRKAHFLTSCKPLLRCGLLSEAHPDPGTWFPAFSLHFSES